MEKTTVYYIWQDQHGIELNRKVRGKGRPPKGATKGADGNFYIVQTVGNDHAAKVETVETVTAPNANASVEVATTNVELADQHVTPPENLNLADNTVLNNAVSFDNVEVVETPEVVNVTSSVSEDAVVETVDSAEDNEIDDTLAHTIDDHLEDSLSADSPESTLNPDDYDLVGA